MSELHDLRKEVFALATQVEQAVHITIEQQQAIYGHLDQLYQKTVGDEDAIAIINQTWTRVLTLADQTQLLANQNAGSLKVASEAVQERDAVRDEWNNLQDAIDSNNEEHPRLHDFSQTIRADAEEEYEEGLEEWVLPEVRQQKTDEINQLLFNTLTYLTGCPDFAIAGFIRLLKGRQQPTEYQLEMLKELFASFSEMKDTSE